MKVYKNMLHDILGNSQEAIIDRMNYEWLFISDFYKALENRDANDPDLQPITEANIKDVYTEFCDLFEEDVDNDKKLLMFQMVIINDEDCFIDEWADEIIRVCYTPLGREKRERYQIDVPRFLKFMARYTNPHMMDEQKEEFGDLCDTMLL